MSIQYVNIGTNPNDGTGDDLRSAFLKVNDNFQLLATIGGETNIGANLGGGTGQVYIGKTNETLNFRTIAGGSGITISQSGNVISINNSVTSPDSFSRIYVGSSNTSYYDAANPNDSFRIKGEGAVQTTLLGNTLTLTGIFNLSDDLAPILSGSLDLNTKNIIGTGNINIVGSATVDTLTVGRPDGLGGFPGIAVINGTLTVNSNTILQDLHADDILADTIVSTSITATTNGFTGSLLGNTTGTHYGNVAIKGVGLDGNGLPNPDIIVVSTAGTPATFQGNLFGDVSGGFTGDIISGGVDLNQQSITGQGKIEITAKDTIDNPLIIKSLYHSNFLEDYRVPTIDYGSKSTILSMRQQTSGMSEALKLRASGNNFTNLTNLGTAIAFESTNEISNQLPNFSDLSPITVSSFVSKVQVGSFYYVTLTIPDQLQTIDYNYKRWTISGNSNSDYNGIHYISNTTSTSVVVKYDTDPGIWGSGTTTITRVSSPTYTHHGWLSMATYGERNLSLQEIPTDYSSFIVRVRARRKNILFSSDPNVPPEDISDVFSDVVVARGNGRVTVSNLDFEYAKIKPSLNFADSSISQEPLKTDIEELDFDLILDNKATGKYINFYGDYDPALLIGLGDNAEGTAIGGYSFPKTIGTPGQVLSVRVPDGINPNNLLEWITPGSGSGGVTPTTFLNLTDTPSTYLPGDAEKVLIVNSSSSGITFASVLNVNVNGNLSGNATTATRLLNSTTINGVTFDGTQTIDLDSDDVDEGTTNQYFTETRVKNTLSVVANKALSYNSLTGSFDINESVSNVANTLIKRDTNGDVYVSKLFVTDLTKNSADTQITISSQVSTNSQIISSSNITTSATVSAGFISLTGTGNQVLTSTAQLVLNPATNVDVSNKPIINLAAPTDNNDATTKLYVDTEVLSVRTDSLQNYQVAGDTGGTLTVDKGDVLSISGSSNISTNTTANGVTVTLKSTISGISITGNLPVSQQVTAQTLKGGNVTISGNAVTQSVPGSDLNLIPGTNGGSVVVSSGDLELVSSRLIIQGFDVIEFPANSQSQVISLTTPTTFVRTFNWTDSNSNLAFADLPNGNIGQIKTIIMQDRGVYGDALDTRPRYLVLSGNINGASRQINIAAQDANGSSTFIFLNNYWWRIANVA
jgi:hypothetical protein